MGHNIDLCRMLGAPEEVTCPKCGHVETSYFDDYDIEGEDPNPRPGVWKLSCYCPECEHDWVLEFRVKLQHVTKG